MPFISSSTDTEALTMTMVAEFDASVERVWQVWGDPRQLERWWGPPTWPATFSAYEFVPGGSAHYFMTGPSGAQIHGFWRIRTVDAPHSITFDDGFADADGAPVDPEDVLRCSVSIEAVGDLTRMTVHSQFRSTAQLEQMAEMGMEEGMSSAMGQIDALLD